MSDHTKAAKGWQRKSKDSFPDELLDQLLTHVRGVTPSSLLGKSGLIGQLKKQLAEHSCLSFNWA
jgi:putative transposase